MGLKRRLYLKVRLEHGTIRKENTSIHLKNWGDLLRQQLLDYKDQEKPAKFSKLAPPGKSFSDCCILLSWGIPVENITTCKFEQVNSIT